MAQKRRKPDLSKKDNELTEAYLERRIEDMEDRIKSHFEAQILTLGDKLNNDLKITLKKLTNTCIRLVDEKYSSIHDRSYLQRRISSEDSVNSVEAVETAVELVFMESYIEKMTIHMREMKSLR